LDDSAVQRRRPGREHKQKEDKLKCQIVAHASATSLSVWRFERNTFFLHSKSRDAILRFPLFFFKLWFNIWVAVISAKNHKRQRRKRQSVTAKREKPQTPKVLTAILTLPNLT